MRSLVQHVSVRCGLKHVVSPHLPSGMWFKRFVFGEVLRLNVLTFFWVGGNHKHAVS